MNTAAELVRASCDPWSLRAVRVLVKLWVFAVVLALYPFTQNPAAPIKELITGWAVFAMCGMYFVGMLRHGLGLRASGPTLLLLGAFLAVNLASALASDYPLNSLNTLRPMIAGGLLAVMVGNSFRTAEQLWGLIYAIVIAVALSSVYGYVQRFGLDPFPWAARNIEEYRGMPSTYANPNFAGHTLIPVSVLALGVLVFRSRWIGGVAIALIGSHLYLTDMRSARVALVASAFLVAVFLLVLLRHRARPLRAAAITLALLLALSGVGVFGGMAYTTANSARALPIDSALILRLNGYYGAARMVMERPLLGFGPGNYEIETPRYWNNFEQHWYAAEGKKNDHVHNDLLETAVDAGLPGAALYLVLFVWLILQSLILIADRAHPERRRMGFVLAGAVGAFAVDGLFGFNLRVPASAGVFFMLVGMLHALLQRPVGRSLGGVVIQAMLVLLALGFAFFGTSVFYAESQFQIARGLQGYAAEARAMGDTAGVKLGYEAALAALEKGERCMPFSADFAEAAGQIGLARGRGDEAVAAYTRAIAQNPYLPALQAGLAQGWITQAMGRDTANLLGDIPDTEVLALAAPGEAAAQKALQIATRYAPAHEALGQAAILRAEHDPANASKHWREAADRLNDALIFGARNALSINKSLARVYTALEEFDSAAAAYGRVFKAKPEDADSWDAFEALARGSDQAQAYIDALFEAIGIVRAMQAEQLELSNDLSVRLAYAYVEMQKNPPRGAAVADLVLQRSATRADAAVLLKYGAEQLDTLKIPLEFFEWPSVSTPPGWLEALAMQMRAPEPKTLPDVLTKVLEAARADVMAAKHASTLRFTYGWPAQKLRECLERLPAETPRAQMFAELPELCAIAQRWEDCAAVSAEALAVLPVEEALASALLRVRALTELGRAEEALVAAREAVRLQPGAPAAKWALAQQLLANGKLAEARFEYQDLLRRTKPESSDYGPLQLEAARVEARLAYAQGGKTP